MKTSLVGIVAIATTVVAKWTNNLNYRSPSEHHPFMGIAIHKVVRRTDYTQPFNPSQLNFTHGVASGDPYHESVILWTRVSPVYNSSDSNVTVSGLVPLYYHGNASEYGHVSVAPICVNWKISKDCSMNNEAASGQAYTSSDIDYTVKVEAKGLRPFTQYYYQFSVCDSNVTSPVGRTKTAPRPSDKTANINLAVFSCSNYPFGFFNAFGNPARKKSVDFVIHLGDFIYEYAEGVYGQGHAIGRLNQPSVEIRTLYEYRQRHASYRADLDSVASFGANAWIPVWDDHEFMDNGYKDGAADQNNTEASFAQYDPIFGGAGISIDQRKMNAVRAYFEWMPIRQVEMDDNLRIWRSFSMGTLFDLLMLDTRNYDRSITDLYWNTGYIAAIANDTGRSMMGPRQESWFYRQLLHSKKRGASWRLIGSQTVFSRVNQSVVLGGQQPFNVDQWDGYRSNRNRTFNHLYTNNITDNIVLAGDSHASWVSDLTWLDHDPQNPYDPATGSGSIGVEFAGTAVTSPSPYGQNISQPLANNFSRALVTSNRELQWQDLYYRGYYELHINHSAVTARYFGLPSIVQRLPLEIPIANFTVLKGANALSRPVGGGVVFAGALKQGFTVGGNVTNNTLTGKWTVSDLETFGYTQKSVSGS